MCEPITATQALLAVSAVSAGLQYQQGKQQQKAQYEAQKNQNELARKNALQRYASEQLRIRQVAKQNQEKGFTATLKARKARAEFISSAGESGVALGGSIEGLLADYYRTQGNYMNALNRNLGINISQYERNLEAIQFGQESQSTYVQPPNPELLFASSALNVANTYYSLEFAKQQNGLLTNRDKNNQINSVSSGAWI
jgi:hypothetical protein